MFHINSPVVIVEDADINVAAQRIVWGKYINAGQTCIAPDYVLCPLAKVGQLVECCQKAIKKYYGENPKLSKDYGRIINDRHFQYVNTIGKLESICLYIALCFCHTFSSKFCFVDV